MPIIENLKPWFSAISASLSLATFGFLISLLQQVRNISEDRNKVAQERVEVEKARVLSLQEDNARLKEWNDREKTKLENELRERSTRLSALLEKEGLSSEGLALGTQLSVQIRDSIEVLTTEMRNTLDHLLKLDPNSSARWQLSIAKGELASGNYEEAAARLEASSDESWETYFLRGLAHANSRGGMKTDVAAVRAYNEAILLAPDSLERNKRAKLFTYRAAVLKRLRRLDEAEADLHIGLSLADRTAEVLDAHYNLACVYAMRRQRTKMLDEVRAISNSGRYLKAVSDHAHDYFAAYKTDTDLIALLSAQKPRAAR